MILAIGHSARDTFEELHRLGLPMEAKAFSVGARIEHPAALIDRPSMAASPGTQPWGGGLQALLPPGSRTGVYTFACALAGTSPGAASEEGAWSPTA